MRMCAWIAAGAMMAGSAAMAADPILQFDLNGLGYQALNSAGGASAFGGTSHTGSLVIFDSPPVSSLNGVLINANPPGPFVNQNFNGVLTDFLGTINMVGGTVTGGSVSIQVNGGGGDPDTYTALIVPNSGTVRPFIGGGFTVEGLTFQGAFDDAVFGNVDVTTWFTSVLTGSFLQFNFIPTPAGSGFADMDIFVVAPAPGSLAGLAVAGLFAARRRRR